MGEFRFFVVAKAHVVVEHAEASVPVVAFVAPVVIPFFVVAGPDEEFHFHLFEFERPVSERFGGDFVAEGLADLGDAEGEFAPHGLLDVFEVGEHALGGFGPQVGFVAAGAEGTDVGAEHEVEFACFGQFAAAFGALLSGDVFVAEFFGEEFCALGGVLFVEFLLTGALDGFVTGLGEVGAVGSPVFALGAFDVDDPEVVGAESAFAAFTVHEGVGEVLDVSGCFPDFGVHDDGGFDTFDVVARFDHRLPPSVGYVAFECDSEGAVVVGRGKSSVYFGVLEYESASFAQADNVVKCRGHVVFSSRGYLEAVLYVLHRLSSSKSGSECILVGIALVDFPCSPARCVLFSKPMGTTSHSSSAFTSSRLLALLRRLGSFRLILIFTLFLSMMSFGVIAQNSDGRREEKIPRPALPGGSNTDEKPTPAIPPINVVPDNVERAEEVLPYLRIGYIKPAEESAIDREWYLGLEEALMRDQPLRSAMSKSGMKGVVLRPCDDAEDMYKRLGLMEFDVAYAPAMVYARHRLVKPGEYNAVLMMQSRDPSEGSILPRGIEGSMPLPRRRGVLFVSALSPLADDFTNRDRDAIRSFLSNKDTVFALSGTYDAAGYLYGLKLLNEEFDAVQPAQKIYFGSPQEVVKAVVTGLADAGVCEEEVLEDVLASIPDDARSGLSVNYSTYVKIYNKKTEWFPTDPVVFRRAYTAYGQGSEIGERLKVVLKSYHKLSTTSGPILSESRDTSYNEMLEDMLSEGRGLQ